MTSSGQLLDSATRHVECAETLYVNGHKYISGCPYAGAVDVWFDPEESTEEVTWVCPKCAMFHTDLMGDAP